MFRRPILLILLILVPVTLYGHFVYLTWNWAQLNGSSIDNFLVKRSQVQGGPYTTIATIDPNTFNYQDNTVLPGNTYYYVVVGIKSMVMDSGNSNEGIAIIPGVVVTIPFISQPTN